MAERSDPPGPVDAVRADPRAQDALRELVVALGEPHAPTTVAATEAWDVHVADALCAVELPEVAAARTIADLGAGAGVPGLVLAAALPEADVALVETVRRKCEFIDATAARCGLGNARAVWSRAETWSAGRGRCDVVTARALAALPVLCEYAAPLLTDGGTLVCWKGAVAAEEATAGRAAAAQLGLSAPTVVPVRPYSGSRARTLWLFRRVGPVPARFPRRPGMALKRPLGA